VKKSKLIGAGWGVGANDPGCQEGPARFQSSPYLQQLFQQFAECYSWGKIISPELSINTVDRFSLIRQLCAQLGSEVQECLNENQRFIVIGGDHSCAMGTWNAVANHYKEHPSLGLIWVDAHLDSHTHETSLSHNIHGMPVSNLLGYGHPILRTLSPLSHAIRPQNLVFIGIRSYEEAELQLVEKLGIRIYFIEEVQARGIEIVMKEALTLIRSNTTHYGITIDLDAFDPKDVPGVGCPEPNGIDIKDFCTTVNGLAKDECFVGAEIAEFNPEKDFQGKTEKVIVHLIQSLFAEG
jgi:arginase